METPFSLQRRIAAAGGPLQQQPKSTAISYFNQHPLAFCRPPPTAPLPAPSAPARHLSAPTMGHKQSKLHRQLKATDDGPSRDLVGGDGGSLGGSSTAGPSSGQAPTPFFDVKQGPFKRKLSVRNISIRRSFHKPSKTHRRLSNSVAPTSSATTDDIVIASSSSTLNNSPFVQSTSAASTTSNCTNNHNTSNGGVPTSSSSPFASVVDGPSTSSASVSLPARAGSFSRASSSGGGHDRHGKSLAGCECVCPVRVFVITFR